MIIAYNPIKGSGPLRVIFSNRDLIEVSARESPEESGVYWIEDGKVLAIEFDDVKATDDTVILTIPESKDRFMLKVKDGNIALESNFFKKLAVG